MTDTTFDQARRCPICKEPGRESGKRNGPHGSVFHTIVCKNARCKWFETSYLIQVNSDGTIPDPTTNREKSFPKLPERSNESVETQMNRLYEQTISGGESNR